MDLVNQVRGGGGAVSLESLTAILAVDPPSVSRVGDQDVPGFVALAHHLDEVFRLLDQSRLDAAATRLNELLSAHPAHPHLAKEDGRWRMHHHPTDARLVPMWTSICAESLARIVAADDAERLGTCGAAGCERVFLDESKNASRRFCSTTCNNRMRSATYRRRRTAQA